MIISQTIFVHSRFVFNKMEAKKGLKKKKTIFYKA